MIRPLLACLLSLAAITAGENLAPHQGRVVLADRSFDGVWVFSESLEGLLHTLDTKRDSPTTLLARNRYLRVDYVRPNDVNWLRGDAAAKKGAWLEAANFFLESAKKPNSWYTRESSFLRAAEAFIQAGKPDDAIKAIDGLLAVNPKCVQQAQLTYLRGQALQKKGDTAGAMKAYADLGKRPEWGIEAAALGATGQAELCVADGKHDEAAKILEAVFAKLDASKNVEIFGRIGVTLAASQQAAGQTAPAIATLRRLAFGATDGASRARAHVAWGKLLSSTDATLFEAFDHAVIAMTARGVEPAVTEDGGQLARQIVARIDKLPEAQASNELKAEYRRYLSR